MRLNMVLYEIRFKYNECFTLNSIFLIGLKMTTAQKKKMQKTFFLQFDP